MIRLRKMEPDEFPDYVAYFVREYASEISANFDVDIKTALDQAKASVDDELGQGVDTPEQVLLCAIVEGDPSNTPVGYLWCTPNVKGRTVFISDFYIFPQNRGQGYGLSALTALEKTYTKSTFDEIRLRVAANNRAAERLYLKAGFRPTGINMRKSIGDT